MRFTLTSLTVALCWAFWAPGAAAYLAPDEVFGDIFGEPISSSSVNSSSTTSSETQSSSSVASSQASTDTEESAGGSYQNPFETDSEPTVDESTDSEVWIPTLPDPEQTAEPSRTFTPPSDESFAPASEEINPVFYRAGKAASVRPEPAVEEQTESPFEELPEPELPEEEVVEPEPVIEEEPAVEEEPVEEVTEEEPTPELEEEVRSAAPQSTVLSLISQGRYVLALAAVLVAVGMYFVLGRKKPQMATADTSPISQLPVEGPQKAETTSPRLQKALKAMQADETKHQVDKHDQDEDEQIAFKDPEA